MSRVGSGPAGGLRFSRPAGICWGSRLIISATTEVTVYSIVVCFLYLNLDNVYSRKKSYFPSEVGDGIIDGVTIRRYYR